MRKRIAAIVTVALAASAILLLIPDRVVRAANPYTLIGWAEYGMHSIDSDYSIFSLSPPHNVIHAQLIDSTGKLVKAPNGINVTYETAANPATGALNTTSVAKSNFWQFAGALFGFSGGADQGLTGLSMPGASNAPQVMAFDTTLNRFDANGIPLTPLTDDFSKQYYPLLKLVAKDATGSVLATTTITAPVSDEVGCRSCHSSGGVDRAMPDAGWVNDSDPQRDYRLNILLKHDDRNLANQDYLDALAALGYSQDGLYQTALAGTSILCVNCHSSNAPAFPSAGHGTISALTAAMHNRHARQLDPSTGNILDEQLDRTTCYRCHPGPLTQALRGVMGHAVAADGSSAIQCQNCHGTLSDLASTDRVGYQTLPNCQSCHYGSVRNYSVFDANGNVVTPTDTTFATNPGTLFRSSSGHGGLMCQACHGPTHAESPAAALDNLQPVAIQGVAGVLGECTACHRTGVTSTNGGPHNMHTVGAAWVNGHQNAVGRNAAACAACHGSDYRGSPLSQAFTARTLTVSRTTIQMFRGYQVSCYTCHNGPSGSGNPPNTPAVNDTSASTAVGQAVTVNVTVTANAVLRIVSQPVGGTAFVTGNVLTYTPSPNFQGTDKVTYAALFQGKDSNLGTATIQVISN